MDTVASSPAQGELTFQLEQFAFDGPLDLLFKLIQKNKIDIRDLPIALLCDQYLETIARMESMDMEVAADFLVMASELMYIKSKMMLPQEEKEEEDPRANLADMLLRYQAAKAVAPLLAKQYAYYSNRFVKDTDEITVDRSFVADQSITALCEAVRRITAYQEGIKETRKATFSPMISAPIVPVELKIVGILHHLNTDGKASLHNLLEDAVSLPDMIAIFLGVLELIKMRQILIVDHPEELGSLHGDATEFILNDQPPEPDRDGDSDTAVTSDRAPSSSAVGAEDKTDTRQQSQ